MSNWSWASIVHGEIENPHPALNLNVQNDPSTCPDVGVVGQVDRSIEPLIKTDSPDGFGVSEKCTIAVAESAGAPSAWTNGYTRLLKNRPQSLPAWRWAQITVDASQFMEQFVGLAVAMNWDVESTLNPLNGFITLIEGGVIMAICTGWAIIRSQDWHEFRTCRFSSRPGEASPLWHVWSAVCEPRNKP